MSKKEYCLPDVLILAPCVSSASLFSGEENSSERIKLITGSESLADTGDTRDYNVSFAKLNNTLKFKTGVSLREEVINIGSIFKDMNLNTETFEHRFYNRIKQIEYLIANKKIDSNFRVL